MKDDPRAPTYQAQINQHAAKVLREAARIAGANDIAKRAVEDVTMRGVEDVQDALNAAADALEKGR